MSLSYCAECGFANPAGALFCGNCGAGLGRPCPSCSTLVGAGLAFCTNCGALLDGDTAHEPAEERKIVTVVFVDLVGFTGRAEQLDPEDVRGVLNPYHARAKAELERVGGTVEKFIGDAVMAVFGAPVTHEDDPERAVRAGLAVREAINELNTADPSLALAVRVGVATGEALVNVNARPERGEALAAGDVINTASRLQTNAPVNGVLVDEATHRATAGTIDYSQGEPVTAKGKSQPIPVWEAIAPRARLGVDIAFRGAAPLVGRAAELDALRAALARAQRERSAQLVTLVGVPGIGKSRLLYELWAQIEADPELIVFWRQGRSLPYGDGVAYWALAEMAKAQMGILENEDADAVTRKLEDAVRQLVSEPSEAQWLERHLRPLAGLGVSPEPTGDRAGEAVAAWRRFFEAIAEQRPLILVFEDIHWADDGLLDFVDHLAEWTTDVPLLIVCTARPELLDRRPGWGGGKRNATALSLSPLSDEETGTLLAALLDGALPSEERRAELLTHAGGNPLYAEEYVRMLAQAEEELPLPESVQGIIAARLDTVPPEEKSLLQAAAILGKVFWVGSLETVLGQPRSEVEAGLHALERREFVRRERRSSMAGETAYVFRHALVRDVAYSQIPRSRRGELHRRAAEWIETLASDRPEDLADMVAHHYSSALDLVRSAGGDDPELAARARTALREAGDRSVALNAFAPAARFYGEALVLWPESDPERPRLLLAHGRALFHSEAGGMEALREAADELLDAGEREEAVWALIGIADVLHFVERRTQEAAQTLDQAVALLAESEPSAAKAAALANRARFHMIADEVETASLLGEQAFELADALGLAELQAHTLNTLGVAKTLNGDPRGLDDLERAVAIAPPRSFEVMRALNNLAALLVELGQLERGFALVERSLEEARRYGHAVAIAWARSQLLDRLYWLGEWDALLEGCDEILAPSPAEMLSITAIDALILRARLRLARADTQGALEDSETALALAQGQGDPQVLFPALVTRARVLVESGSESDAGPLVADLLARWRESPATIAGPWVAELAEALDGLGRGDEFAAAAGLTRVQTRWRDAAEALAGGDGVTAAAIYDTIGAQPEAAAARLRAAEQLLSTGPREKAEAELAHARSFFERVGAELYLRRAEALLAPS